MDSIKTYGFADWRDWYKFYELEYKLAQLKPHINNFTDSQYIYFNKLKTEFQKVLQRLLKVYYDAFWAYIEFHVSEDEELGYLAARDIVNILGEEFFDVFDDIRKAVESQVTLEQKVLALNKAKNFAHSYRQHVVGLSGQPNRSDINVEYNRSLWNNEISLWDDKSIDDFYKNLTQGNFVPEWQTEFEKMEHKLNWYKKAQNDEGVFDLNPLIEEGEKIKFDEEMQQIMQEMQQIIREKHQSGEWGILGKEHFIPRPGTWISTETSDEVTLEAIALYGDFPIVLKWNIKPREIVSASEYLARRRAGEFKIPENPMQDRLFEELNYLDSFGSKAELDNPDIKKRKEQITELISNIKFPDYLREAFVQMDYEPVANYDGNVIDFRQYQD